MASSRNPQPEIHSPEGPQLSSFGCCREFGSTCFLQSISVAVAELSLLEPRPNPKSSTANPIIIINYIMYEVWD